MRLLERLRAQPEVEIHLILTRSGEKTLHIEMGLTAADARKLAHFSYSVEDIGSRLASGSLPDRRDGDRAVLDPHHVGDRGGDQRQSAGARRRHRAEGAAPADPDGPGEPFHLGHLRTMTALAEMGAIIAPPDSGLLQQARRP